MSHLPVPSPLKIQQPHGHYIWYHRFFISGLISKQPQNQYEFRSLELLPRSSPYQISEGGGVCFTEGARTKLIHFPKERHPMSSSENTIPSPANGDQPVETLRGMRVFSSISNLEIRAERFRPSIQRASARSTSRIAANPIPAQYSASCT